MKFQIDYKKLEKEAVIRSIKMLDISLLTILYFLLGYVCSWAINKLYFEFDPNDSHNKILVILEVCLQIGIIGIIIYIIRNIIGLIPFPLEGVYGYKHKLVKELYSGGIAISFGVFFAQYNIKEKMDYILNK